VRKIRGAEDKKPLSIEELVDEIIRVEYPTYERAIPGLREAIIRKKWLIKRILEQRIRQACMFYLKYRGKPDLLIEEHPELGKDALKHWDWAIRTGSMCSYDEWLFRVAFRLDGVSEERMLTEER